jgi:hypothetical protein
MPNYNNGKIYCIKSYETEDIYIGSTTQKLCKRMGSHRRSYKAYKNNEGNRKPSTAIELLKY